MLLFFFSFLKRTKVPGGLEVGGLGEEEGSINIKPQHNADRDSNLVGTREWRNGSCWSQRCYLQWRQIEVFNACWMSLLIYYLNVRRGKKYLADNEVQFCEFLTGTTTDPLSLSLSLRLLFCALSHLDSYFFGGGELNICTKAQWWCNMLGDDTWIADDSKSFKIAGSTCLPNLYSQGKMMKMVLTNWLLQNSNISFVVPSHVSP